MRPRRLSHGQEGEKQVPDPPLPLKLEIAFQKYSCSLGSEDT